MRLPCYKTSKVCYNSVIRGIFITLYMRFQFFKIQYLEKALAIIIIIATFTFIPFKVIKNGFLPTDDVNRHVAFSTTNREWSDVLEIAPKLEADHNVGWHKILRFLHKRLCIGKKELIYFSIISLFLLVNLTGSLVTPNFVTWSIALLIMFLFDRTIISRLMLGRPYLISCATFLVLIKIWTSEKDNKYSWILSYSVTIIILLLAVWIHGTWYNFLLLPLAMIIAGKFTKSLELTLLIILSTLIGAYLTGNFNQFLHYHFYATLNIFKEQIFNWQLVSEFAEGDIHLFWIVPTLFIIILLIHSKRLKFYDLSSDTTFIFILLSWLLSIKVIRFWVDWGIIALMFWLSLKLSLLIQDMQSIKRRSFKWFYFLFIMISLLILIPRLNWNNQKEVKMFSVDFSKQEYSEYEPKDGGIVYNDSMKHFYFQYYNNPEAKYKYVLGFEPAIMKEDDKKIYRDIVYSGFYYKLYKPWIDKITDKDRIFASVDLSDYYPKLDWIKAGQKLYIGKLKETLNNNIYHTPNQQKHD